MEKTGRLNNKKKKSHQIDFKIKTDSISEKEHHTNSKI